MLGGIEVNRKMLAELAMLDPGGFSSIAAQAKQNYGARLGFARCGLAASASAVRSLSGYRSRARMSLTRDAGSKGRV